MSATNRTSPLEISLNAETVAHRIHNLLKREFASVHVVNDVHDENSPAEHQIDADITDEHNNVYNVLLCVISMGPRE